MLATHKLLKSIMMLDFKINNNVFVIVLGNEILADQIKNDINNNTIYDKLNITYDNKEY